LQDIGSIANGAINAGIKYKEGYTEKQIQKELLEGRDSRSLTRLADLLAMAMTFRYMNQINLLELDPQGKDLKRFAESGVTRVLCALFNKLIGGSSKEEFIQSALQNLQTLSCNTRFAGFAKQTFQTGNAVFSDDELYCQPGLMSFQEDNKVIYYSNDKKLPHNKAKKSIINPIIKGGLFFKSSTVSLQNLARPYEGAHKTNAAKVGYMIVHEIPSGCPMTKDESPLGPMKAVPSYRAVANVKEKNSKTKVSKKTLAAFDKQLIVALKNKNRLLEKRVKLLERQQRRNHLIGRIPRTLPFSGAIAPYCEYEKKIPVAQAIKKIYGGFKVLRSMILQSPAQSMIDEWIFPKGKDISCQLDRLLKLTNEVSDKIEEAKKMQRSVSVTLKLDNITKNLAQFKENIMSVMNSMRENKKTTTEKGTTYLIQP